LLHTLAAILTITDIARRTFTMNIDAFVFDTKFNTDTQGTCIIAAGIFITLCASAILRIAVGGWIDTRLAGTHTFVIGAGKVT
jgi:hypothetical protein